MVDWAEFPYQPYKNYGNDDPREDSPWFYCSVSDQMYAGSPDYGPGSTPCREYLKKKCAVQWDDICEAYSHKAGFLAPDDYSYVDKKRVPEGKQFVRMVGEAKYCRVGTDEKQGVCAYLEQKFNPLVPNSPTYVQYSGPGCVSVCDIPVPVIDPIADKLVAEPEINKFLLDKICYEQDVQNPNLIGYCQMRGIYPKVVQTAVVPIATAAVKQAAPVQDDGMTSRAMAMAFILVAVAVTYGMTKILSK